MLCSRRYPTEESFTRCSWGVLSNPCHTAQSLHTEMLCVLCTNVERGLHMGRGW